MSLNAPTTPAKVTAVMNLKYREYYDALLRKNGADMSPLLYDLMRAARDGDTQTCKQLLCRGVDVNKAEMLWHACDSGHRDICALAIKWGADVNQGNHLDESPLLMASYNGHVDICKLLLENGADIWQPAVDEDTPCTVASHEEHTDVCKLLDLYLDTTYRDEVFRRALEEEQRRHKANIIRLKRKFTVGKLDLQRSVRQRL